jgi:hypothetical protein
LSVREYWARVTATQSDVDVRFGTPVTMGDQTAVEWWTTLSNGGVAITLAACFMLRFDASGRCRTLRECWHFAVGTRQPKAGWGE